MASGCADSRMADNRSAQSDEGSEAQGPQLPQDPLSFDEAFARDARASTADPGHGSGYGYSICGGKTPALEMDGPRPPSTKGVLGGLGRVSIVKGFLDAGRSFFIPRCADRKSVV